MAKSSSAKEFIVLLTVLGLIKSNILWIIPIWVWFNTMNQAKAFESKPGPKPRR